MSLQDTTSDLLTRVRNAVRNRAPKVRCLNNKLNRGVCDVLRDADRLAQLASSNAQAVLSRAGAALLSASAIANSSSEESFVRCVYVRQRGHTQVCVLASLHVIALL